MNGKTKNALKSRNKIPAQRIHILLDSYHFLLKNSKRLLWVLFWFQNRDHVDFGLCEFFKINKELQTFCFSCGKQKKVSLKKGAKSYCLPLNHGNCIIRKTQKEALPEVYFLTEKGLLLE